MAAHNRERERGSLKVYRGGKQATDGEGGSGGYAGGSPDPDAQGGDDRRQGGRVDGRVDGVGYDRREFITPASDEKGHGQPASVRFPPSIGREISKIISSHRFPYETNGDLIRHALLRHLRWLSSLDPELEEGGGLARIKASLDLYRDEMDCLHFKDEVARSDTIIQALLDTGAKPRAVYLLHNLLADVEKMGDEYWVEKYRTYIRERWGSLLQGASLKPSDADQSEGQSEVEKDT